MAQFIHPRDVLSSIDRADPEDMALMPEWVTVLKTATMKRLIAMNPVQGAAAT